MSYWEDSKARYAHEWRMIACDDAETARDAACALMQATYKEGCPWADLRDDLAEVFGELCGVINDATNAAILGAWEARRVDMSSRFADRYDLD